MALNAEIEAFLRQVSEDLAVTPPEPPAGPSRDVQARRLVERLARFTSYIVHPHSTRPGDVYIGRPTRWATPVRLADLSDDDERRRRVLTYAEAFVERSQADQRSMLSPIRGVLWRGDRLFCCTRPQLCHGLVLVAAAAGVDLRAVLLSIRSYL